MDHAAQERVQHLIDSFVSRDEERGIQVAAYLNGELIVDAWAGIADPATGRPVNGETLFPVFSSTKGIAATAVNILAARGLLDYEAPIAALWPEFGAHGKERITLRQALSHLAGIPQMPDGVIEDVCNWAGMCRRIADLTPLWPPGTRFYYHAMTFGWIVGEVARLADGRDFGTIIKEEISRPLGIDSLFVGIPDHVEARIAVLETDPHPMSTPGPPVAPAAPDPIAERAVPAWLGPLDDFMKRPDIRRACIPASNGIMTARAIARHYAALIGGGVDGIRLFNDDVLWKVTRRNAATDGPSDAGYGLGYVLYGPVGDPGSIFGHGGHGGSRGVADARCNFAVGIAKNRLTDGRSADQIILTIREALS